MRILFSETYRETPLLVQNSYLERYETDSTVIVLKAFLSENLQTNRISNLLLKE